MAELTADRVAHGRAVLAIHRRLVVTALDYLYAAGWTAVGVHVAEGELSRADGFSLTWGMDPATGSGWVCVQRSQSGSSRLSTVLEAEVWSTQMAVDLLVTVGLLPERMASWGARLDEVAR